MNCTICGWEPDGGNKARYDKVQAIRSHYSTKHGIRFLNVRNRHLIAKLERGDIIIERRDKNGGMDT